MSETDRLAAAWPIVCGTAMAAHGEVTGYQDGVVEIVAPDDRWRGQMFAMRQQIAGELARTAGVPVTAIHFERTHGGQGWAKPQQEQPGP